MEIKTNEPHSAGRSSPETILTWLLFSFHVRCFIRPGSMFGFPCPSSMGRTNRKWAQCFWDAQGRLLGRCEPDRWRSSRPDTSAWRAVSSWPLKFTLRDTRSISLFKEAPVHSHPANTHIFTSFFCAEHLCNVDSRFIKPWDVFQSSSYMPSVQNSS